ncbi:MAG: T9SS type A sorting domain-containing protein [Bacteroidota bacterium]
MKKLFTLLSLLTLGFSANATIHVVNVASNTFTPSSIPTVIVGDTIRWNHVSGSHTTTSSAQSIPAGAAVWNSPITSSNPTFDYKVTVAGTYGYICTPHAGMGMVASFVATAPTATISKIQKTVESKVYPNPFTSKVTIVHNTADKIEICTLLGETVKTFSVSNNDKTSVLDLSELKSGVYFYVIKLDNKTLETRRIIKSEQ